MNSLRIAQDFLTRLSLWLGWGIFRAPKDFLPTLFFGCAMTTVILIAIGLLSCWFLLYALTEWTQDLRRKPGTSPYLLIDAAVRYVCGIPKEILG
jgi:hypothetical protein